MRKMVMAALVAVATIGSVALTPSTADADDRRGGRGGWRYDRSYYGGHRHHHHNHWHGGYGGGWYNPGFNRYRVWSPYYYATPYYAPYGYYGYPSSGIYLNFRF
jgi:hypothetical protein